jgi:acetate kinase
MKAIVSLNAGSSSIKFAAFALEDAASPRLIAGGKIEKIGIGPLMSVRAADGTLLHRQDWPKGETLTHAALLEELSGWLIGHLAGQELAAIGHRIVHGGMHHAAPRIVDEALMAELEALCALAPLHQPHNLAAVRAMTAIHPGVPQVACFDTAFHRSMPESATRFALPRALHEAGIRRYGFHGLSYEFIIRQLRAHDPSLAAGRVIAAHLGNGASLCAISKGRSVDTTMGFTALDGLMMGTRCGTLDPGVVIHLQTELGMSLGEVEALLYRKSGLLGVSGISSDMRALHAADSSDASDALDLFAWRTARECGAMAASLGGVDAIVFTAGIGENDAHIRRQICERLEWLGIRLDSGANKSNERVISSPDSAVRVLVIPTDEELMIALHSAALIDRLDPGGMHTRGGRCI